MKNCYSTQKINEIISTINGFPIEIDQEEIIEARNFAILWPLFENKICSRNCNYNTILKASKTLQICEEKLLPIWTFFCNRYLTDGKVNQNFTGLRLAKKLNEMRIIIETPNPSFKQQLFFCLYVVYRFRNNLFHGEKEPKQMWQQRDLFEQVNKLLIISIEAITAAH